MNNRSGSLKKFSNLQKSDASAMSFILRVLILLGRGLLRVLVALRGGDGRTNISGIGGTLNTQ